MVELRPFKGHISEYGIYVGVPREYYFSFPALSRSEVLDVASNPKNLIRKKKESKSLDLGDVVHTFFNEREIFNDLFYLEKLPPVIDGKKLSLATKEGKEWKSKELVPYLKTHIGKHEISQDDSDICQALDKELNTYKEWEEYKMGIKEVMIYNKIDFGNGISYDFKCRMDSINFELQSWYDLKTTARIETYNVRNSKAQYFYDVQLFIYNELLKSFFPLDWKPKIIWVETRSDFPEVRFDESTWQELETGKQTFLEALDLYHKAKVNHTMGEPLRRFDGWENIGLPNWLINFDNSRF